MHVIIGNDISAYFFLGESLQVYQLLILAQCAHVQPDGQVGRHGHRVGAPGGHTRATHCQHTTREHCLFIRMSNNSDMDHGAICASEVNVVATQHWRMRYDTVGTPRACVPDVPRLQKRNYTTCYPRSNNFPCASARPPTWPAFAINNKLYN